MLHKYVSHHIIANSPVGYVLIPCHFLPYRQSHPPFLPPELAPHENVTAAILSYAVSHLHEGTGKLRKTYPDTVGHLTESVPSLSEK